MSLLELTHDLRILPLRALLAFAVRCVRRVQPLYSLPAKPSAAAACATAIDTALKLVEQFVTGEEVDAPTVARIEEATICALMAAGQSRTADPTPAYVANAAYAITTALKSALESSNAVEQHAAAERTVESAKIAIDAANSADPGISQAAKFDWEMIHRMRLGAFPELGKPIDPTETGILGPLKPAVKSKNSGTTAAVHAPNIDLESPTSVAIDEAAERVAVSGGPVRGGGIDPESMRKLEMFASMIRTRQKELQEERTAFEDEKKRFEVERHSFELERAAFAAQRGGHLNHSIAGLLHPTDLSAERIRLAEERATLERERNQLLSEKADLVQQEADLHKELRKLQEERKRLEPKEDSLRTLSRQQAAQTGAAEMQAMLSRLQEERQRLNAEREQLSEVLALVNGGCFKPPQSGQARKSRRCSPNDVPRLQMILEPGTASPGQMSELFRELSALNTDLGGPGIRFVVEDVRVWNVAKMANRKHETPGTERSFVEVHMIADVESKAALNLAVWGRFASSLFMSLRLDAGLANYFDLSESAPNDHKIRKCAADAVTRAADRNRPSRSSGSGLMIDALNSRMQRIEEFRRRLEHETGLVLELLPQSDEDDEPACTSIQTTTGTRQAEERPVEKSPAKKRSIASRLLGRSNLLLFVLTAAGSVFLANTICVS